MARAKKVIDSAVAIEMYKAGYTLRDIGETLGVSHPVVSRHLTEAGVTVRKAGAQLMVPMDELAAQLDRGVARKDIAAHFGVHQTTVEKAIYRMRKNEKSEHAA